MRARGTTAANETYIRSPLYIAAGFQMRIAEQIIFLDAQDFRDRSPGVNKDACALWSGSEWHLPPANDSRIYLALSIP